MENLLSSVEVRGKVQRLTSPEPLLNITDGASACTGLENAGIPGKRLGWDDVLHEGPVPGDLSLEALADVRARFLSNRGWGTFQEIRTQLRERTALLRRYSDAGQVVLWSTSELYAQLHLWQIMDWFEKHISVVPPPSIIRLSGHFSDQNETKLRSSFLDRRLCSLEDLSQASEVWQHFCSSNPQGLAARYLFASRRLPFEQATLRRLLEEYPDKRAGVTRTQRQILTIIAQQPRSPGDLFRESQALEAQPFLDARSFFARVSELTRGPRPAVVERRSGAFVYPPAVDVTSPRFADQQLALSSFGEQVLAGYEDFIEHNGIDRWIGGVNLQRSNDWRWNGQRIEQV